MTLSVDKVNTNYRPIITHDIDRYYKWKSTKSLFGEYKRWISGNSRWSGKEIYESFRNRRISDPFSNIKQIVDINNEFEMPTVFYVMTTEVPHDKNINDYHISGLAEELAYALSVGAEVGLHSGYTTAENLQELRKQKKALEAVVGKQITRNRQHYFKRVVPETYKILEELGFENDSSTPVFSKEAQNEFWNTRRVKIKNKEISLTGTPVVFMETHHMDKSDEQVLAVLEKSLIPAKERGGEVMILWHNNSISCRREVELYRKALKIIKN